MRIYKWGLWLNAPSKTVFFDITPQVKGCMAESGVRDGLCLDSAMHITSVSINNEEEGLRHDLVGWLGALAPMTSFQEPPQSYRGEWGCAPQKAGLD